MMDRLPLFLIARNLAVEYLAAERCDQLYVRETWYGGRCDQQGGVCHKITLWESAAAAGNDKKKGRR